MNINQQVCEYIAFVIGVALAAAGSVPVLAAPLDQQASGQTTVQNLASYTVLVLSDNEVKELSIVNTVVSEIYAINSVSGAVAMPALSLLDDAGGRFALVSSENHYQLVVKDGSLLDHETAPVHGIQIQAVSSTGKIQRHSFSINITDMPEWTGTSEDEVFGLPGRPIPLGDSVDAIYDLLAGNDSFFGAASNGANDTVFGGIGNDQLYGRDGDDVLYGEGDEDRLDGHGGYNVLVGGIGADTLVAAGDQTIIYTDDLDGAGAFDVDTIEVNVKYFKTKTGQPETPLFDIIDFTPGIDFIQMVDVACDALYDVTILQTLDNNGLQVELVNAGITEMRFRFHGLTMPLQDGVDYISTCPW